MTTKALLPGSTVPLVECFSSVKRSLAKAISLYCSALYCSPRLGPVLLVLLDLATRLLPDPPLPRAAVTFSPFQGRLGFRNSSMRSFCLSFECEVTRPLKSWYSFSSITIYWKLYSCGYGVLEDQAFILLNFPYNQKNLMNSSCL